MPIAKVMITSRNPERFCGTVGVVQEMLGKQVKVRMMNYSVQVYPCKQLLVYRHFNTLAEDDGTWPKCKLCDGYMWKFVPYKKPKRGQLRRGQFPSSVPIMHAAVVPFPCSLKNLAVRVFGLKQNTNYCVRVCARLRKMGRKQFLGVMSKVSHRRKTLHNFSRGDLVQVTEAEGKEWMSASCEGNVIELTLRDKKDFRYNVRDVASGLQASLDFSPNDSTLELPRPEFVSIEHIDIARDGMRAPRTYVYKTKQYETEVTVVQKKELDLLFYPLGWRQAYTWSHVRHYKLKVNQLLGWKPDMQARVKAIYPGKSVHPSQRAQQVPEDKLQEYFEKANSFIKQCGSVIVPALVFVMKNGTQLRFQHKKGMWFRLIHLKNRKKMHLTTSSIAVMLVRGPTINTAPKNANGKVHDEARASFYELHNQQVSFWSTPGGKVQRRRRSSSVLSLHEDGGLLQSWGTLHFANGTRCLGCMIRDRCVCNTRTTRCLPDLN